MRHSPCFAPADRGQGRPGAASMSTDSESGTENLDREEDRRRALHALKIMHERGLLPTAEYERRVQDLAGKT